VYVIDVTERNRSISALRESESRYHALADQLSNALRIRDDFMAIASHELRTPLTSIQLQMELLRRSTDGTSEQELTKKMSRITRDSARQVRRLNRLIHEMLDVSRIARVRPRLRRELFALAEFARDTIPRVKEHPPARGIPITLDATAPVKGD